MKFPVPKDTLHVSRMMDGKMAGIECISTSCFRNPLCQKRGENESFVCSRCYARRSIRHYSANLAPLLERNYEILSSGLLQKWQAQQVRFNTVFGRIEAFGDVANEIMAMNYIQIVRANPCTKFAAWTKNPGFWSKAIKALGKPRNLSIVYSSPILNKPANPEAVKKVFPFVDHIFTVYTKDHQEAEINCGSYICAGCQRCYKRTRKIDMVNERLK